MARTIDIDIRGQICPSCLLLTLKELNLHGKAIRGGDVQVVVVTDDRQATATIPAAAARMGLRTQVDWVGNLYRIRIFGCD